MHKVVLPIDSWIKGARAGCSACGQLAPFTLQEFEDGPVVPGWQLRLIATEVIYKEGGPARGWR